MLVPQPLDLPAIVRVIDLGGGDLIRGGRCCGESFFCTVAVAKHNGEFAILLFLNQKLEIACCHAHRLPQKRLLPDVNSFDFILPWDHTKEKPMYLDN